MVYPAILPLMRTPRLPVVDRTDAPADLNGLVRFAERRNLVSARVPSHFNWPILKCSEDQALVSAAVWFYCSVLRCRRLRQSRQYGHRSTGYRTFPLYT